jgi:hypothetical protein
MSAWNINKVEILLRQSLRESLNSPLYFDVIDYHKYNLSYYEVKKVVERYTEHMYGDVYKYSSRVWVTVEPDRIKIEKR